MITRDQAEHIAAQFVGAPANDPDKGWDLKEFDAGWLVQEKAAMNLRGAGSYVIERGSGRVMSFPLTFRQTASWRNTTRSYPMASPWNLAPQASPSR